jgi:hypothetical protein
MSCRTLWCASRQVESSFGVKAQPITSKAEYEALVKAGKPLVVDFYAP